MEAEPSQVSLMAWTAAPAEVGRWLFAARRTFRLRKVDTGDRRASGNRRLIQCSVPDEVVGAFGARSTSRWKGADARLCLFGDDTTPRRKDRANRAGIISTVVVFPAAFGPRIPKMSPTPTVKLTPSTTGPSFDADDSLTANLGRLEVPERVRSLV